MLRKDLKNPYWILLYRKEKKKQANWSEPIKNGIISSVYLKFED